MKFTCYLCVALLVLRGICGGVLAFTGYDPMLFLCGYSETAYKCLLAVTAVSALFTVYALIVFKPFKGLN